MNVRDLLLTLTVALCAVPALRAQVVLDGTLGTAGQLAGPHVIVPASAGQSLGGNLFHSFSRLDIAAGESVTFQGPGSVQNVLARVTSGSPSNIDGILSCDIPGADLYLINPAGVVFGPGATLEVRGSFIVTSADFIRLGTDGRFDARTPTSSVLVTSPPAAFGFAAAASPGAISVQGGSLGVPNSKGISLVGGDVRIVGGELLAGSGNVNLIAGPQGEAVLSQTPGGVLVDLAPGVSTTGAVEILDGTNVDVSGTTPGRVTVRAASMTVRGAGVASGGSGSPVTAESPLAIDIKTPGLLELGPGGFLSTGTTGTVAAGDVRVVAGDVTIDRGDTQAFTGIGTQSAASGRAGTISVQSDTLSIANGGGLFAIAGSSGQGGGINVDAAGVELVDGGQIVAQARASGNGGDVTVNAAGAVSLDGSRAAIVSDTAPASSGDGGRVDVRANELLVSDTAFVSATTNGSGAGGEISIAADGLLGLDGAGKGEFTGIGVNTQPGAGVAGRGGSVVVMAHDVHIREGAGIATKTFGGTDGGQIEVNVEGELRIDARQSGQQTGLNAEAVGAAANGGSITVSARRIELQRGQITASAVADGGTIQITAPRTVHLFNSEIVAEAGGNGGNVVIDPVSVVLDRSRISANAVQGNGGNITIRSQAFIPSADPETIVSASSEFGLVGNIEINAPDTEIAGALVKLSGDLAESSATLQPQCGAMLTGNVSSFVATGRGGAPPVPGGWLAAFEPVIPNRCSSTRQ